jgi:exopolysaccharide production protein ExoZ
MLAAPARLRPWLLTAALGGLTLTGLVLRPQAAILATYTSPLLLEFLAGVWIGKAWIAGRMPSAGISALLLLGGIGGLAAVAASGADVEPVRLLLWGVPGMAIVAGALGLEAAGQAPVWPAVKFLGDASYSIYLVHALAISLAVRLGQMAGLGSGPLVFVGAIAVGLAAGSLCYLLVERPLLRRVPAAARRRVLRPVT